MLDRVTIDDPLEFFFRADIFTFGAFDVILDHCEKVLLLGDVSHSLDLHSDQIGYLLLYPAMPYQNLVP